MWQGGELFTLTIWMLFWGPLSSITVCLNDSLLLFRLSNKSSERPAGDEGFLWPASTPGGFVCPCARCCISILPHTEAHCLLFTVAQHILLSLLPHSSAHARYSGGWAEERNLRCWLELHSFINLWENHLTLRWPAEVISWPTPATSVKQSFLILVKVDVFVHFLSYVYTFINYDSCGIF